MRSRLKYPLSMQWTIALLAIEAALGAAQPPQPLEFEAASVKVATEPPRGPIGARYEKGRFLADSSTMQELITAAYPYQAGQQIVGPSWISSRETVYNIVATASGAVNQKDLATMLQHLLAQRFGLQLHTQQRLGAGYALVTSTKGFQVPPVTFDGPDPSAGSMHLVPDGIEFSHASMKIVAGYLGWMGRPVANETGLTGLYDFRLHFATRNGGPVEDPAIDSDQPSVFTALEKIGLKLEKRQVSVTDYIVDHVERVPVGN